MGHGACDAAAPAPARCAAWHARPLVPPVHPARAAPPPPALQDLRRALHDARHYPGRRDAAVLPAGGDGRGGLAGLPRAARPAERPAAATADPGWRVAMPASFCQRSPRAPATLHPNQRPRTHASPPRPAQCGHFQPIADFDGAKRTCRRKASAGSWGCRPAAEGCACGSSPHGGCSVVACIDPHDTHLRAPRPPTRPPRSLSGTTHGAVT